MPERVGVYPGTFDPITNGHQDVIHRAARTVDRLIVAVAVNAGKGPMFSLDERLAMVREDIAAMNGVAGQIEARAFDTLLINFVRECGASQIIRGLRAVSDFEYEFQMAAMNTRLDASIETVFLMASEGSQFISSRFVKEISMLGGDISSFVSPRVKARLDKRRTSNSK
ncbi:MAG TPA: pantetheine-phosphate adenylyltransferase [Magnetospirillaceae bacterium]